MRLSKNEEDYLKALFHLVIRAEDRKAGSNQLADSLDVSPASVNSMLKKLRTKKLVDFQKYGKVTLTEQGHRIAVRLIRKHRLWETFLYQHLNFTWDEVHEVAEQLEHVQSEKLVLELERFLGYPETDPHGAVIPSEEGQYRLPDRRTLAELEVGDRCELVSVKDSSAAFLKYVSQIGLALSSSIQVLEKRAFDSSMLIGFDNKKESISAKFAENIFVQFTK